MHFCTCVSVVIVILPELLLTYRCMELETDYFKGLNSKLPARLNFKGPTAIYTYHPYICTSQPILIVL